MAKRNLVYRLDIESIDDMHRQIKSYVDEHNVKYEDVSFNIYSDGTTDLSHED